MCNVIIKKSTRKEKKLMAVFTNCKSFKSKTTHFGQAGAEDFRIHRDVQRKQRYISRHKKNENWDDPFSAGSLSRFLLWNKPTLLASIIDYKRRFNF
jgi:hypothetical protein